MTSTKTTELLIDILLMLSRSPFHFQSIFFSVESHKIAKFSFHFEQTALSLYFAEKRNCGMEIKTIALIANKSSTQHIIVDRTK